MQTFSKKGEGKCKHAIILFWVLETLGSDTTIKEDKALCCFMVSSGPYQCQIITRQHAYLLTVVL